MEGTGWLVSLPYPLNDDLDSGDNSPHRHFISLHSKTGLVAWQVMIIRQHDYPKPNVISPGITYLEIGGLIDLAERGMGCTRKVQITDGHSDNKMPGNAIESSYMCVLLS